MLGRVSDEQERALGEYGLSLGLVFQVTDDILDLSSSQRVLGKPVGSDLKEGKMTLPLVYALQSCDRDESRKIETVLREKAFRSVSKEEILAIVTRYRVLEKARERAEEFAGESPCSHGVLSPPPPTAGHCRRSPS